MGSILRAAAMQVARTFFKGDPGATAMLETGFLILIGIAVFLAILFLLVRFVRFAWRS